jgi:hypothetical protein
LQNQIKDLQNQIIELNKTIEQLQSGVGAGGEVSVSAIVNEPEKFYGKKVVNYKKNGTYRIFYVDKENYFGDGENTVYLKVDYDSLNETKLETSYTTNTLVKKMNKAWSRRRNDETIWNNNEKASAWLCDPESETSHINRIWSDYYDSTKANYVIGSPSVEMYVKSYNDVSHTLGNHVLGSVYSEGIGSSKVYGYLYTVDGGSSSSYTDSNTIDYQGYNSIYAGFEGKKGYNWWLASPSSNYGNGVCYVYGYYANLNYSNYSDTYGVSPLVCLKSDFQIQIEMEQ